MKKKIWALASVKKKKKTNTINNLAKGVRVGAFCLFFVICMTGEPFDVLTDAVLGRSGLPEKMFVYSGLPYIRRQSRRAEIPEKYAMPVEGQLTARFGVRVHPVTGKKTMHRGVDIGALWHAPVKVIAEGVVVEVGSKGGYGNHILVEHPEGFYSFYAHLSRVEVKKGQALNKRQVIGFEGGDPKKDPNPGTSTGHHLHFEIRLHPGVESCVNPGDYVKLPVKKKE